MQRRNIIALFCLCFFAASGFNARSQAPDSLIKKFNRYTNAIIHEKIYLHLDKTNYLTGETLWMKLYCVEGMFNTSPDLSKVAYVEIKDRSGKAVVQGKIQLENGKGEGSFFLPATLNSDNYTIVSYTNWMKNSSKEYFFSQPITIINPFRKLENLSLIKKDTPLDIQFLPEGGTLLGGNLSKIAFRAVDVTGRGISFTGFVKDENGDSVVSFAPSKFGLGNFTFTPDVGKKYQALITDQKGKQYNVALPEIQKEGYALSLQDLGDHYFLNVMAVGFDQPVVHLFVHTKNQSVMTESAFIKNGMATFSILKNKLKGGISHLTIFDSQLQPVAERLVYTKVERNRLLEMSTDAATYSERRPVKIKLIIDRALPDANLSVAITRKDSLDILSQEDIQTYLDLTSDLHGQIESPGYYLNEAKDEEIDNLMLTHGWRRFSWEKILKSDYKYEWFPELEGPMLEGMLFDETGKPAKYIGTFLSTPSNKIQLYNSVSGPDGKISYTLKNTYGPSKLFLQTNFSKDSLYDFKLESPFSTESPSTPIPDFSLSPGQKETLLSRSVAMQVTDIFSESENSVSAVTDTIPFYGRADETYYLDDYTRFPVMEEVMREYIKGVWVRKRQSEFHFLVLDNINKTVFNENPLILLDGVPVFRVNDIMNISPLKIKKIEVATRQFFLGRISFPGIVSYSTYSKDLAGIKMDRRNLMIDYEGLQQKRKFFAPIYETERQRSNRLPDQRNTLLWIPSLKLTGGQAEFDCFTSDVPGRYEINVQGITDDGTPISAHHTFTVSDYNN
jgi:hypothetical protein